MQASYVEALTLHILLVVTDLSIMYVKVYSRKRIAMTIIFQLNAACIIQTHRSKPQNYYLISLSLPIPHLNLMMIRKMMIALGYLSLHPAKL